MSKELAKAYEPQEVEGRIYDFWMRGGYFHAQVDPKKKPYTIVIPPPNITGQLHMGHAWDETLQDILIRWKRMQGYSALWLPGTDHASIATEAKIVEAMREEGLSKEDLGRDGFLERAWAWKEKFGGRILEQLKLLGSSCDWDRLRFTMDEGCSKAVRHVFVKLYEEGLIYRGSASSTGAPTARPPSPTRRSSSRSSRVPSGTSATPLADGSGYIELATTRPETMLGDTAVAVHPEDGRYKDLVGKNVILPLVNKEIPIVADEYVEMDFGTGVVKITPAHDPNDFEVGRRHSLPVINVMNEDGSINENGGKYAGLSGLEARKRIVKDLEEGGYLIKVEPLKHNVGTCQRCHTVVEPRVSTQWFVKMEPLAKSAVDVVKDGEIRFIPERLERPTTTGWRTSRTGASPGSYSEIARSPPGTARTAGRCLSPRRIETPAPTAVPPASTRTPTPWTPGSPRPLWPFSTLGWPDNTPSWSTSTPPTPWSPATTSSSSGWHG